MLMTETGFENGTWEPLAERQPPGFSPGRLIRLMRRAIANTRLDLSGMTVLTEAATGAYGVTPVIAALAGAKQVHAVTRPSLYGSVREVVEWISRLATAAGCVDQIRVSEHLPDDLGAVDIVTNSGHLRPLSERLINQLASSAVIALMYETWEYRPEDVDLAACARRGIPIVGVNEHHPAVDVFSFLGEICVKQLHDAGQAVYDSRIALLCDNSFAPPILASLLGLGARAELFGEASAIRPGDWDAAVVALRPATEPRIGRIEAARLAASLPPQALVVQVWGDIDRSAAMSHGLTVWPAYPPTPGHMAVLLSDIGPGAIVRLQTGGLRAAEWVRRGGGDEPGGIAQILHIERSPAL